MPQTDSDTELLLKLQKDSFQFFAQARNPANGLVRDSSLPDSHASIAVGGTGNDLFPGGCGARPDVAP